MCGNVRLTTNQKKAIRALLASPTIRSAAQACGLNEKTVARYLKQPAFRAALNAAEGDLLDSATRRLIAALAANIDTMEAVRDDTDAPSGVRLRAAQVATEQAGRLRELRNVEDRLAALEAAILLEGE